MLPFKVFGMKELFCCPRAEKDGTGAVPKIDGAGVERVGADGLKPKIFEELSVGLNSVALKVDAGAAVLFAVPSFGVSQHTHLSAEDGLLTMQVEHSHESPAVVVTGIGVCCLVVGEGAFCILLFSGEDVEVSDEDESKKEENYKN